LTLRERRTRGTSKHGHPGQPAWAPRSSPRHLGPRRNQGTLAGGTPKTTLPKGTDKTGRPAGSYPQAHELSTGNMTGLDNDRDSDANSASATSQPLRVQDQHALALQPQPAAV